MLTDVCKKDILSFVQLGLSVDDLLLLNVTIVGLLGYGFRRQHMPLLAHFSKLKLADWKLLGLNELFLMDDLEVDATFLTSPAPISKDIESGKVLNDSAYYGIGWCQTEELKLQFLQLFPDCKILFQQVKR